MRHAFISLPFIGSAHAARFDHNHGYSMEVDREAGDTTVWLGRWEVNVSGPRRGVNVVMALPLLTAGAMLAALIAPIRTARAVR